MVPADSDRISRVPPYSGYPIEFTVFRLQDCHLLWFVFPYYFNYTVNFLLFNIRSYNPNPKIGLGSFRFARHY